VLINFELFFGGDWYWIKSEIDLQKQKICFCFNEQNGKRLFFLYQNQIKIREKRKFLANLVGSLGANTLFDLKVKVEDLRIKSSGHRSCFLDGTA